MKIRKHKNLNKKIWDNNDLLKKPVADVLMLVARSYIDSIREAQHLNIEFSDVGDVCVYGSIANYFYTKQSDIDLCIALDFDSVINKNPKAIVNEQNFRLYYYNWAMTHRCRIYGRKVDVSIKDVKKLFCGDRYCSGPWFSVMKNEWLFKPTIISDTEFKKICSEAKDIYKQIIQEFHRVKRDGFKTYDCERLYSDIYTLKKTTTDSHTEYPVTPVYIAFRKLRHRGIMAKLRDQMVAAESKPFILK